MNKEIKAKWLEALRSGKYQQTRGVLRRDKPSEGRPAGMCCLGVLCDIINPNGWEKADSIGVWSFRNAIHTGYPPEEIIEASGIGSYDLILTASNDGGDSFEEIADYIEANL